MLDTPIEEIRCPLLGCDFTYRPDNTPVPPETLAGVFRKSSYCGAGSCVEVAHAGATVAVRDGKNPTGPRLRLRPTAWTAFLDGIRVNRYQESTDG